MDFFIKLQRFGAWVRYCTSNNSFLNDQCNNQKGKILLTNLFMPGSQGLTPGDAVYFRRSKVTFLDPLSAISPGDGNLWDSLRPLRGIIKGEECVLDSCGTSLDCSFQNIHIFCHSPALLSPLFDHMRRPRKGVFRTVTIVGRCIAQLASYVPYCSIGSSEKVRNYDQEVLFFLRLADSVYFRKNFSFLIQSDGFHVNFERNPKVKVILNVFREFYVFDLKNYILF